MKYVIGCLLILMGWLEASSQNKQILNMGLISRSSTTVANERFLPLVEHINRQLEAYKIVLHVLHDDEINDAVMQNRLDIILTNPGQYVMMKHHYALSSTFATLQRTIEGHKVSTLGGVIVTLKNRNDIKALTDLKNKKISIPTKEYFAGYKAQMYELKRAKVDADAFATIATGSHERAIHALLEGKSDAAFVRSGVIEDMVASGKVNPERLRVINEQPLGNYPYKVSTKLYPEWPFFALPHVDNSVIAALMGALFTFEGNASLSLSFVPPKDYRTVEEVSKVLKLPPFDNNGDFGIADIVHKYTLEIVVLTLFVTVLALSLLINLYILKRLRDTKEQYQQIFEYAANAVVIYDPYNNGEDFVFADINKQVEVIDKVTKAELIGKKVTEAFPSVRELPIFEAFKRVYRTGKTEELPIFLYADGERSGYRSNIISRLPNNQLLVMYKDETAKEYSQKMLDTTMRTMHNIVLSTVGGEELEWCNDYTLLTLGYTSIEAFKKDQICICKLFIEDPDEGCIGERVGEQNWVEYTISNKQSDTKAKLQTVEGLRYFSIKANALEFDRSKRHIIIMDDITELEASIATLKQQSAKLLESSAKLEASEKLFRLMFDFAPIGMALVDAEGKPVKSNQMLCSILGYSVQELSTMPFPEFTHPDDVTKDLELYNALLAKEIPFYSMQKRYYKKDGTLLWGDLTVSAIFDADGNVLYSIGMVNDITERKVIEEEHNEFLHRFHHITANIPGALYQFTLKPDGTFSLPFANEQFTKIYNISLDEVKKDASVIFEHIYEDDKEKVMQSIQESANNASPWHIRYRNYLPSGEIVWLEGDSTPEMLEDGTINWYGYIRDITTQKTLEEELRKKEELMLMQSRQAAMGEMISMIAHQWRQPLSVVSMIANYIILAIEMGTLEEVNLKEKLDEINQQAAHMSQTIDDFKDFFKPEKMKESTDMGALIQSASKLIAKTLYNNDISLELSIPDEVINSEVFPRELIQVLLNLINNAKDALVNHQQSEKIIQVALTQDINAITITLCDNGPGIDESIRTKVFEPYFTTKGSSSGTGLGLYIAKNIIEKHMNGRIFISEQTDRNCFVIELPKTVEGIHP